MNVTSYIRTTILLGIISLFLIPSTLTSQSVSLKIPLRFTDKGGYTKLIWFGVHPQASACVDTNQFTPCDIIAEAELPPSFSGIIELRQTIPNNCGGGQSYNGIRPFTSTTQVDTFNFWCQINDPPGGFPATFSWPPNLAGLVDSIRLIDVTFLGKKINLDMTKVDTVRFSPFLPSTKELFFNAYVYHPKLSPPMMNVPTLSSPANNATNQDTSLTLTWQTITGANYYQIQVSTDSLFSDTLLTDTSHSTSKSIGGLAQAKKHYWRVSAHSYYLDGCYQATPSVFTTKLYPPVPPTLLAPLDGGTVPPTHTIKWKRTPLATSYRLQVARDPAFATIAVDSTLTDTSVQVGPLKNCVAYSWKVFASNTAGTTPSAIRTFTISAAIPAPPLLLSPADSEKNVSTSPTFVWQSSGPCTQRYRLQLASDSNFTAILLDSVVTDTSFHYSGDLDTVTWYYWRVNASGSLPGSSAYVRRIFQTTAIVLPQMPVPVTPADSAKGVELAPLFSWNKVNSAKTFHLQVATDELFTSLVINDSTINNPDTSKLADSLQPCTTYYWHVRAKNVAGVSVFSPMRTFETLVLPPAPPVLNFPVNDIVDVTVVPVFIWSSTICATTYHLQIARDSAFTTIALDDSTIQVISRSIVQPLSGRANYYWHVRAKSDSGWGQWSALWHFKTMPVGTANWSIPLDVCETGGLCDEVSFGMHPTATYGIDPSLGEYELSDRTPGFFDLRFVDIISRPNLLGNGVRVNLHHFSTYHQVDSFRVQFLKGFGTYPMKLSWLISNVKDICDSMLLIDEYGGTYVKVWMDKDSTATVTNSAISTLYIIEYSAYPVPVGVRPIGGEMPKGFALYQNYPNPFNPSTRIDFAVDHAALVQIAVYDVLGRQIALLTNSTYLAGHYAVQWNGVSDNGAPMPSGVYYVRMLTSGTSGGEQFTSSRKMLLLK